MRFIKLWEGITDWRYAKSPYHTHLLMYCLLEAWYADAKEFKRGTFRTSIRKFSIKTGISSGKLVGLLKDLSSGDNPELLITAIGYTEITILNYDKYQNTGVHKVVQSVSPEDTECITTDNKVYHHVVTKEEYRDKKHVYAPRQVEELFVEELKMYPKALNDFDIKTFNDLNLEDKKIIAKFASSMGKIWGEHRGEKDISKVTKLENVIKTYLSNEKFITSTDVVKQVLKIDYKKENRMPTYQEMVAAGKIKI